MSTINTEVCKEEINRQSTLPGRKHPNDWKRISKRGTDPIVRVFQHRVQQQWATVTEVAGAIASVVFSQTAPAAEPPKKEKAAKQLALPQLNEKASKYYFTFVRREDGRVLFAVCPIDYWEKEQCLSDETDPKLEGLLPPGCSRWSESQYTTRTSWKQLRQYMLAKGFKENEDFTSFMDDEVL